MNSPTEHPALVPPGDPHPARNDFYVTEFLREMRDQRQSFDTAQRLAAQERKSERRGRLWMQVLLFGTPLIMGVLYFLFFITTTGFQWGPLGSVVGVVRIDGPIAANERASAASILPSLQKAFENPNVKAVVLSIDSPGGAPVEAERISTAIETLKKQYPKEVVAVVNNVGASAAYMVAVHADKIIAAKYSFVGSIGAIMAPWRLDRALAKFDVSQRVYASGNLKSFLNPFSPVSPEVDAKAQHLVDYFGTVFLQEVKDKRGKLLRPGVNYGTGEVWSGQEAKELGLVDSVGTMEDYMATKSGLKAYDFGPTADGYQFLGRAIQDAAINSLERLSVSYPLLR